MLRRPMARRRRKIEQAMGIRAADLDMVRADHPMAAG